MPVDPNARMRMAVVFRPLTSSYVRDIRETNKHSQGFDIASRTFTYKGAFPAFISFEIDPSMELCFIDNNAPLDRLSQKRIRSHAMKGKNLGKTIENRGQKKRKSAVVTVSNSLSIHSDLSSQDQNQPRILPSQHGTYFGDLSATAMQISISRNYLSGSDLSYFTKLANFTSTTRYLFQEFSYTTAQTIYPRTFCRSSMEDKQSGSWFESMMDNPCVFHCGLAMAGLSLSRTLGQPKPSVDSLRHLMEAIRLLRHELSITSTPHDSSLAVIVSLAMHANFTDIDNGGLMHLQAVKRIMDLRPGGLLALCRSVPLIGSKIRRADLDHALMTGSPTLFGPQFLSSPYHYRTNQCHKQRTAVTLPPPLCNISSALQLPVKDVLALCSYAGHSQLGAFEYQDLIISISQHLVDYAPLAGSRPATLLDDVCQLAFLAFMTTIVHYSIHSRPKCSKLLSDMLWQRLHATITEENSYGDELPPSFCLWLVLMYAISAPKYEEYCHADSEIARHIRDMNSSLPVHTWDDTQSHLVGYPWVSSFHDVWGRKLWEASMHK